MNPMVLTFPTTNSAIREQNGFWLEEFSRPLFSLSRAGANRDRRFPQKGAAPLDPVSDTPRGKPI